MNIFKEHSWRWVILGSLGIIIIILIGYAQYIKEFLQRNLGLNYSWVPDSLRVAIIVAPFAYLMWLWRDQNKIKDQKHVEAGIRLKEKQENRLKEERNIEITQRNKEEKILAMQRTEGLIAKLSDKGLSETVRVYTAYQLREMLPADSEEKQDIIKILEVYRSIIAIAIKTEQNNYLATSIKNIMIDFIRSEKYKWYIFRHFNFDECCFGDMDLSGYQFEHCSFENAEFKNVTFKNLSRAVYCDFKNAKFNKIFFTGVDFSYSKFSKSFFPTNINFSKAILYNTRFADCYFNCNFQQARFQNTQMWGVTICRETQFDNDIEGVLYNIEKYQDHNEIEYDPCQYGFQTRAKSNEKLKELLGEPVMNIPF